MITDVPGDIVECGIGRGRSLLINSTINYFLDANEGGGRAIYAYDSFEGFPEPTNEDDSVRDPKKGEWSMSPSGKYKYSKEFTQQNLSESGLPTDIVSSVSITKWFFSDSLKKHPNRPIALLHIDGDLYSSYMDTLENLYDMVSKGGVIVFDDFLAESTEDESFPGARKVVKEFLGDKFNNVKVSVGGTNYYIKD